VGAARAGSSPAFGTNLKRRPLWTPFLFLSTCERSAVVRSRPSNLVTPSRDTHEYVPVAPLRHPWLRGSREGVTRLEGLTSAFFSVPSLVRKKIMRGRCVHQALPGLCEAWMPNASLHGCIHGVSRQRLMGAMADDVHRRYFSGLIPSWIAGFTLTVSSQLTIVRHLIRMRIQSGIARCGA